MTHSRRQAIGVGLLYGLIAAAFCAPLFERPNGLGISDWDQHLFYYASVLKNVVEYGQLPFWNPWYCGGNVLWQNPQIALLSPAYALTPLMSLALAMKVNILLHYWIGFLGMHLLLTRVVRLESLPLVIYLSCVFTLAGGLALHLNAGHSVFLPAFYLPLLVFFFLRAIETGSIRGALLAGAVLALTIYNGGLHIVPMAVTAIGSLAIVAAAARRSWRPILLATIVGAGGLAYAAPKILPVALFVQSDRFWDTRTGIGPPDYMTSEMVVRAYVDRYQTRSTRADNDVQRHGWYEYGNYVGSFAAIALVSSLVWIVAAGRSAADGWLGFSLASTTALFIVLVAGEFGSFAPATLLAHLPLFSSFRIPSRYTVAAALLAPATIGWTAQSLGVNRPSGGARLFVGLICAFLALELFATNRAQFNGVFPLGPLEDTFHPLAGPSTLVTDRAGDPYGPDSPMLRTLMRGQSFYNCYESLQLRHTADADSPLVYGDGQSRVTGVKFTPNRIEFSVVAGQGPARVVLNQNDAPGWSSTAGPVAPDPASGKPSVTLEAGQAGRFAFVFVPPGLWAGVGIAVAALAGSAAVWKRRLADG